MLEEVIDFSTYCEKIQSISAQSFDDCTNSERLNVIGFMLHVHDLNKLCGDCVDDSLRMYMRELDHSRISVITAMPCKDDSILSVSIAKEGVKGLETFEFVYNGDSVATTHKPKDFKRFMDILKLFVVCCSRWIYDIC